MSTMSTMSYENILTILMFSFMCRCDEPPTGHVLNRLPTIVEDDEEVDTIIPDAGIAIMPDTVADRGAISYEGVRYVLTVNNPATNSPLWGGVSQFGSWFMSKYNARYICTSYEKGASGTKHIQGYFELNRKSKLQAVKNKIRSFGGWVAPAKGTAVQSVEYISHTGKWIGKGGLLGGPWEEGTIKTQGQRTDIHALSDDIKAGKTMKQLATDHTESMLKYCSNAQKLHSLLNDKRETG